MLMKELDGVMKNQRNTFKNLPEPSKLGGADRSGVTEGSAQEGTDCAVMLFTTSPCNIQATHGNDPYHLHLLRSTCKLSIISQRYLSTS